MKMDMYNKSKVWRDNTIKNLESAKNNATIEDSFFDIACFDAQQAIEFILKATLKQLEIEYSYNGNIGHDILYLYNTLIENTDFSFDKQEDLEKLATTITSWEQKGRYNTGIRTKEETVLRVLKIYDSIDESFQRLIAVSSKDS